MKKNYFYLFLFISLFLFSCAVNAVHITNDFAAGDYPYGIGEYYAIVNTSAGIYAIYPYLTGGVYQLGYQLSNNSGVSWGALTQMTTDTTNKTAPRAVIKDDILHVFYSETKNYEVWEVSFNATTGINISAQKEVISFNTQTGYAQNQDIYSWGDVGVLNNGSIYFWYYDTSRFAWSLYCSAAYYAAFCAACEPFAEVNLYYLNVNYSAGVVNISTSSVFTYSVDLTTGSGSGYLPRGTIRLSFYNDTYYALGVSYAYFTGVPHYCGLSGCYQEYGGFNKDLCLSNISYSGRARVYLTDNNGVSWITANPTGDFIYGNCYYYNFLDLFFDEGANLHVVHGVSDAVTQDYLLAGYRRSKSSGLWAGVLGYAETPDMFEYMYYNNTLINSTFGDTRGHIYENGDKSIYGFYYPDSDGGYKYKKYQYNTSSYLSGDFIDGAWCNTDFRFPKLFNYRNMQYNQFNNTLHIGVILLNESGCIEWLPGQSVFDWLPNFTITPAKLQYYDFDLSTGTIPATANCVLNSRINSTCLCMNISVDACYFDSFSCLNSWCCGRSGYAEYGGNYNSFYCSGGTTLSNISAGAPLTNMSGGLLITNDTENIAAMFGLATSGQKLLAGLMSHIVIIVGLGLIGLPIVIVALVAGMLIFLFYAMGFYPAWLLYLMAILGIAGVAAMLKNMFGGGGS